MKTLFSKNSNLKYYVTIILIIIILGVAFYWYEYRPSEIRKECQKIATWGPDKELNFDNRYKQCLLKKGLSD